MSLFSNTGGGAFGQNNQQPAGGGLFGNAQNAGTTSSLFGNSNQPQQQPQQSQPSLFSNPSGLFGGGSNTNTNTNTTQGASGGGLFGGQSGGSVFGSNTNQQQQQQPAAGGGLFGGGTQQQQQQQPALGGGLFGNTQGQQQQQQPALGGGLFGSSNQQQGGTSGGGLLGSNTQQQGGAAGGLFGSTNPQGGNAGGGLFGSTNQQGGNTGGGGLFGSTNPQQGGTSGGGLFGSTNQQQGGATGGGLFGSTNQSASGGLFGNKPAAGGLFGSTLGGNNQQSQQQQGTAVGLFGGSTQQQRPGGLFGGNTSTLGQPAGGLGASTLNANSLVLSRAGTAPAQKQEDAQAQFMKLTQKIEAVYNAWNPNSPQCQFQHPFYNLVDPNQVNLYGRPPNATNDAVWEKAVKENPDPSCMVPVVAVGFDSLRERVEAQARQAEQHQQKLKELKSKIEALNSQHAVSTSSRLQRAAGQQAQLTQRLLAFIQHLHLLIPAIRSSSIRPEEEQLRGQLEQIEDEIKRGRVKGKLNELWALLGAVNAAKERRGTGGGWEWAVVDEDGLTQLAQILAEQQAGLAHLTKILQKDMKDLGVIMGQGSGPAPTEDSHMAEGEQLWSSTNTLRASALR